MSNSNLTSKDINHIAQLANLDIAEKDVATLQSQLSSVLEYVQMLNQVPTEDITPTCQVTGLTNVFAKDEIDPQNNLTQDEALANTKIKLDGYFQVPAVISKE